MTKFLMEQFCVSNGITMQCPLLAITIELFLCTVLRGEKVWRNLPFQMYHLIIVHNVSHLIIVHNVSHLIIVLNVSHLIIVHVKCISSDHCARTMYLIWSKCTILKWVESMCATDCLGNSWETSGGRSRALRTRPSLESFLSALLINGGTKAELIHEPLKFKILF